MKTSVRVFLIMLAMYASVAIATLAVFAGCGAVLGVVLTASGSGLTQSQIVAVAVLLGTVIVMLVVSPLVEEWFKHYSSTKGCLRPFVWTLAILEYVLYVGLFATSAFEPLEIALMCGLRIIPFLMHLATLRLHEKGKFWTAVGIHFANNTVVGVFVWPFVYWRFLRKEKASRAVERRIEAAALV